MTDTYRCAICGEPFQPGWSDREALAEMRSTFGDIPEHERGVVCDDCYPIIMAYIRKIENR